MIDIIGDPWLISLEIPGKYHGGPVNPWFASYISGGPWLISLYIGLNTPFIFSSRYIAGEGLENLGLNV